MHTWQPPLLDQLSDRISHWWGYEEVQFIHTFSSFIADIFLIDKESLVFKEFFKQHRNDSLLLLGRLQSNFPGLQEIFPDDIFTYDVT